MRSRARSALVFPLIALLMGLLVVSNPTVADAARKITGKQIKDNSVTTKDIKNRSLLAKDFKPGQLPAGAAGPQGPAGDQGPVGPAGDPATADGTAVIMGHTRVAGATNCIVGPLSGVASSASCNQSATGTRSVEMPLPTAKTVQNVRFQLIGPATEPVTMQLALDLNLLGQCAIDTGETQCVIAGPMNAPAGAQMHFEANTVPSTDILYSLELGSPTAPVRGEASTDAPSKGTLASAR